jgi:uncharacterized membrane protein YciS (DUF1049 family)
MNIPIEIISVFFGAILALQGWTLVEIMSLKIKLADYDDLKKRIRRLEENK